MIFIAPQGHFRRAGRYDVVGFQCVLRTVGTDSWGRVGEWLGECTTRYGSSIRGGSGHGLTRVVSVEKLRVADLGHGEIGATMGGQTRVLTCQAGC